MKDRILLESHFQQMESFLSVESNCLKYAEFVSIEMLELYPSHRLEDGRGGQTYLACADSLETLELF